MSTVKETRSIAPTTRRLQCHLPAATSKTDIPIFETACNKHYVISQNQKSTSLIINLCILTIDGAKWAKLLFFCVHLHK